MLEDLKLQPSQLVCITSNSGSNMVKAAKLADLPHLTCFGHSLHNAVNNGLACNQKVARAIATCHNVSIEIAGYMGMASCMLIENCMSCLLLQVVSAFAKSWYRRRELLKAQN